MKQEVEKLLKQIDKTNGYFGRYLQKGSNLKALVSNWNKVLELVETTTEVMGRFDAAYFADEPIRYPYKSDAFMAAWSDWKKYLAQQWSSFLSNKREQKSLDILRDWCKEDEDMAIYILNYSIVAGAKTPFFTKKEVVEKVHFQQGSVVVSGDCITDETSFL